MNQNDIETEKTGASRWLLLVLAAILVGAVTFVAYRQVNGRRNSVIASINGQEITLNQFKDEAELSRLKRELANRPESPVNRPELMNRMIGDVLLLQAAENAGVQVKDTAVQAEIDAILNRLSLTREEMARQLEQHDLGWAVFEGSVRDYLVLSKFVDDSLLADVAPGERKQHLDSWMLEQYRSADMTFDQGFLDSINSDAASVSTNG
ncbi:MAG: SurA N-terminal domain-containing protein [Anaerolineae bacterium]